MDRRDKLVKRVLQKFKFKVQKQLKSQPNISIKLPKVISRYNENMGEVNLLDQFITVCPRR
jgi:hypothetical protein